MTTGLTDPDPAIALVARLRAIAKHSYPDEIADMHAAADLLASLGRQVQELQKDQATRVEPGATTPSAGSTAAIGKGLSAATDRTPEETRQYMLGVVKGWSRRVSYPDLEATARHFIEHYTQRGGCSNCGGLPHTNECFVGRFQAALQTELSTKAQQ